MCVCVCVFVCARARRHRRSCLSMGGIRPYIFVYGVQALGSHQTQKPLVFDSSTCLIAPYFYLDREIFGWRDKHRNRRAEEYRSTPLPEEYRSAPLPEEYRWHSGTLPPESGIRAHSRRSRQHSRTHTASRTLPNIHINSNPLDTVTHI